MYPHEQADVQVAREVVSPCPVNFMPNKKSKNWYQEVMHSFTWAPQTRVWWAEVSVRQWLFIVNILYSLTPLPRAMAHQGAVLVWQCQCHVPITSYLYAIHRAFIAVINFKLRSRKWPKISRARNKLNESEIYNTVWLKLLSIRFQTWFSGAPLGKADAMYLRDRVRYQAFGKQTKISNSTRWK